MDIQVSAPHGYIFYPAAVAATTTEEERLEAYRTGNLIPGSIDLSAFVKIDDTNANTRANPSADKVVQVELTAPVDLPDSYVGKTIEIPIIITAEDDAGNSGSVYVQNNFIALEIVK